MGPTIQRAFLLLLAPLFSVSLSAAAAPAPTSPISEVRYHFGDNPAWANPNFDDRSWAEAANGVWQLPHFHSDGMVWVRFRVPVPAHSAAGLALRLIRPSLTEAAEQVFLDGTLIGHNGKLPPAPEAVVLQNSTFAIGATIPAQVSFATVALRLWYPPSIRYRGGTERVLPQLAPAATLNERQRADRLALILSWVPVLSLNALLALLGVGLLGLWFWSRRRELLWFSLLLVFYPLQQLMIALPAFASRQIDSGMRAGLIVLGDFTTMFVTVEFLRLAFDIRNRWLRILLHSAWVFFNAAFLAAYLATSDSHVAWMIPIELVALSIFNLGTLLVEIRFLVTGPNRAIAAGMVVIPIASWLGSRLHQGGLTDLFGIPNFDLFNAGFVFTGAVLSIMLVRRALAASRQGAHLRMELAAAREVQQNLVPAVVPRIDGFRVDAAYLPAQEVGGDFYQILPYADGAVLVVVGDVSGKGLKAAMTGTLALGALRNMAQDALSPSQILSRLNVTLAASADGGFVTCACARIAADGILTVANAGHIAPYQNGEEVPIESGLPLGIAPGTTYSESTLRLVPNDQLTFISDGVVEAQSPSGELFGFDRTAAISSQSAESIAQAAQQFGQMDDITVLTLTFAPAEVLHA